MRIYAVADIHGRPDRIERIRINILKLQPDVLVVAGDITHFFHPRTVVSQLNDLPVPVLAIRGNSDLRRVESLFRQFPNIFPLHLKKVSVKGLPFMGLSGTIPLPFDSRVCFKERGVMDRLRPLVTSDAILVAHPPPRGARDEVFGKFHAGSRNLYRILKKCKPRLLICGHIHERAGTAYVGNTLVVNCAMGRSGEGAVIEVEKKQVSGVIMV